MPELRLTLLVVGLIFLIGLTWWELRRPHQARGAEIVTNGLQRVVECFGDAAEIGRARTGHGPGINQGRDAYKRQSC